MCAIAFLRHTGGISAGANVAASVRYYSRDSALVGEPIRSHPGLDIAAYLAKVGRVERRHDALCGNRFIAAIPYELKGDKDKIDFSRELCEAEFGSHGLPWEAYLHPPGPGADLRAWHLHIICGDRPLLSEAQLSGAAPLPPKNRDLFRRQWIISARSRLEKNLIERGFKVVKNKISMRHVGPRHLRRPAHVDRLRARRLAYNREPLPGLSRRSAETLAALVERQASFARVRQAWKNRAAINNDLSADRSRLRREIADAQDLSSGEKFAILLAQTWGGDDAAAKMEATIREDKTASVDSARRKVRADFRSMSASMQAVSPRPKGRGHVPSPSVESGFEL